MNANLTPIETTTASLPRILLGDDHRVILDAMSDLLRDQFDVLAVDDGTGFVKAAETFHPQLAVLDVGMPGEDGFSTAHGLAASGFYRFTDGD